MNPVVSNLYVNHNLSASLSNIPVDVSSVKQEFGVNKLNCGAGNVQFLFDLYDNAATISSSSNIIVFKSGNTLPILLGKPSLFG